MAHGPSDPAAIAHDHVEADITDLGSYITDVTGSPLDELSDVAAHTPTKGHLLVADGTDWEALAVGSDDEVLTADSAEATGVKWAAGSGDVVYADNANAAVDISELTDVTVVTADITSVAAGDILIAEVRGTLLNNSGSTRSYTQTPDFDGVFAAQEGSLLNNISPSATNREWVYGWWSLAVVSTSEARMMAKFYSEPTGASGNWSANMVDVSMWDTTSSDLTGTVTVDWKVHSSNAAATQNFYVDSFIIRKVSST